MCQLQQFVTCEPDADFNSVAWKNGNGNGNIYSKLSLHDLDEKMTSAGRKENERKNRTDSIYNY